MDTLRALPSVHQLLDDPAAASLLATHGRPLVRFAIQQVLDQERQAETIAAPSTRWQRVTFLVENLRRPRLRPVINATGIVLHTNLGRAPLAPSATAAAAAIGRRYSTLEFDPQTGRRGRRHDVLADALRHLTGAEAAAVVNNCAAAVLLMLTALAKGKEVIVGRGELVEIGGGVRMPEIMRLSGARLVEVGTTNRTRLEDYAAAIGDRTAAILKVHASNFQLVGFTETVELKAVADLARRRGVLLLHDLGSGSLLDPAGDGLRSEPRLQDSLQDGADLVVASGDKLLGGPQAGLLLGGKTVVDRVMKHPLARALRVDKLTLAALAATLDLYLTQSTEALPIWQMIRATPESIARRAEAWRSRLSELGVTAELMPSSSEVGGGSLPGERIPTTVLALTGAGRSAATLLRLLREHEPPLIGRIQDERVLLDPRTVLPDEDDALLDAVAQAMS